MSEESLKYHCKFCFKERDSEEYAIVDSNNKIIKITYHCGTKLQIVIDRSGRNTKQWSQKCR